MGYLTIQGHVVTFNDYKEMLSFYKYHGLRQFLAIYHAHKDRHIEENDLHWGEEIEYSVFSMSDPERAQLFSDAFSKIDEFNQSHQDKELHLQPEFGNWMIEAVPSAPYGDLRDPS